MFLNLLNVFNSSFSYTIHDMFVKTERADTICIWRHSTADDSLALANLKCLWISQDLLT